jgi:hypothetical protein
LRKILESSLAVKNVGIVMKPFFVRRYEQSRLEYGRWLGMVKA